MGKLHFCRTETDDADAEGTGTPDETQPFDVLMTWRHVEKGKTYWVYQGTHHKIRDAYHCEVGASTNAIARFKAPAKQDAYVTALQRLHASLAAVEKKVSIEVAPEDQQFLKRNNYRLCFAKKVGDDFNVVWQSYRDYLANNKFSWTPLYQLFGSNLFQDRIRVEVSTDPVDIHLGEKSTLDSAGVLSPPKTGGPEISVTMDNEFAPIHPGLNQLSTGIDGNLVSTPIYVAPNAMALGTVSLTPKEEVLVWFEQNIETSTMFSDARSKSVEIDLTFANQATRRYQNGRWILP